MELTKKKYNNWQDDMDMTMPALNIIQQTIFKKSKLVSIEKSKDEILMWLDQYSGIDWIAKTSENHVIGIAARIQWDHSWDTFTIRFERHTGAKTEYAKRVEAIDKGYMYPKYTLQAYFKRKPLKLLSCGIIDTKDLYSFIEFYPGLVYESKSDNIFKFIHWQDLINNNVKVKIF